jgi:mannose-6-phosphate isomerase-like protein (cupin superfamily)
LPENKFLLLLRALLIAVAGSNSQVGLGMSAPIIASPLAGQVLGSIQGNFVVAEWNDAGGPAGPRRLIAPRHVHHRDDEAWYVLEGTLRVLVGTDEVEARAGSGVLVPRGTPHTYWNPGPGPARYLLVMTANTYSLIQDIHAMTERTPATLRAVFAKHDSELLEG